MGELAQLAGRPSLVDAYAKERVKALIIPPYQLRALLIAEAELGERIMRALILRRVGLLQTGAGPVILGRAGNADVLRLDEFLRRNGHPRQQLDPETDAARFVVTAVHSLIGDHMTEGQCRWIMRELRAESRNHAN